MGSKVEKNKTIDSIFKCYCNRCKIDINHKVLGSINETGSDANDGTDWWNDYEIIECVGCNQISFRHHGYFSEYADYENNGTYEHLYPESAKHHKRQVEYSNLPYNLDSVYEESVKCFNAGLYILCATAIRSITEGICNDKGIKKGLVTIDSKSGPVEKESKKLDGKINGLFECGLLTTGQVKALHQLRFLGNEAIHDLEVPTRKELLTAFGIVEHILSDLYELPDTTRKLEKRREGKKKQQ